MMHWYYGPGLNGVLFIVLTAVVLFGAATLVAVVALRRRPGPARRVPDRGGLDRRRTLSAS
ncbi:hypothetical protein [Saccharothrix syringae]|uniref:Uncharacterized protein n=1 Tax=Saccharothrix syringae TaxID=103733 RepID=A0A5Q0H240_SACSY|nr:hypothetical protein [Saccharothrix syringae]QFZ20268.1 hypothetical protein EKG83_25170 [Saccharothrix syringae]